MKESILLIANPAARRASSRSIEKAAALFRSKGYEVTISLTRQRGEAEELAKKASRDRLSLVVAAGGDGTFNEVVNGLAYTDTPMAILPMGTTNVLAKELGIPEILEGAVARAIKGSGRSVSLGKITANHPPSGSVTRYFCLMAGIGFDGEAVYRFRSSLKRYSGRAAYVLSGLKTLLSYAPEPLLFSVDGNSRRGYSAIVGKASRYGGNFQVTPDAALTDPHFHLVIMEGKKRRDVLRYVCGIVAGGHLGFRDISYLKADAIRIEGRAAVQVDGDYLGFTPAEITVAPQAVKLVY
ncbi:MAG TPA: diacylglycerol kinase family protein [Thermodesulfovibrionales bacterium]|nr:diacylglycerol kinase family protein [Thermodesulfovibrionales bacterium]